MKKHSSLPRNWPQSSSADLEARPQRVVVLGGEQEFSFCGNDIKTSKYEWWNFLPKFLLEEFNPRLKFANCYFLLIAGLQIVPAITNTSGYPTVLIPLLGVLLMAGVLKAVEDVARHKADRLANASRTEVFDAAHGVFKEVQWSQLRVGDLVRVKSRQTVPADLVLLQAWEPNPQQPKGACYVETKSLDGETNLKFRSVLPCLVGKVNSNADLAELKGRLLTEHPNNLIDHFTGVFESATHGRVPIFPVNVALRGCVLRSTDFVVGIAVNTGHDVKIMQSKMDSKVKASNLEALATKQVVGVILLLLTICVTGALGQVIFNETMDIESFWYLKWTATSGQTFIIKFFYMLLLHASFVPVALYVSMALVRFAQAKLMERDKSMFYGPLEAHCSVRTMTLNEELGQVSHIFSDKTGTLTCNVMSFRKASINGVAYGRGITEIGRAAWRLMGKPVPEDVLEDERQAKERAVPHVAFFDPDFERDRERDPHTEKERLSERGRERLSQSQSQAEKIREFYRLLAVCHEVIPERLEDGRVKNSAPNPDDEALVCAAAFFGYEFVDRRDGIVVVREREPARDGEEKRDTHKDLEIELLYTIPFSSARKRMSVIVRDVDGRIKVVSKGADSAMFARSVQDNELVNTLTAEHLDRFSTEGLRCLVVAVKELDEEQFSVWRTHYDAASTDLNEMEKKKRGELNDIETMEDFIEKDLRVIGATGIEDRLQEGVPECIEKLSAGGIKVWVLTGDKEETAINIAVACNLVSPPQYMDHIVVNTHNARDNNLVAEILRNELIRYKADSEGNLTLNPTASNESVLFSLQEMKPLPATAKPRALIIDGPTLIHAMADAKTRDMLLLLTQCCQSVVCCRVSPDQKREIVSMIKDNVPGVRTLAVGDGANDVAMITAAHVGVGIRGEEGVQAVNAADYAIAQFRFLTPLLLKHGRHNYVRMSNLICYMFYKNILMSLVMFWFNFFNAFSGLKFFTEAAIQFYNLFYTAVPILLYATYDEDLLPATIARFPQLYRACIRNDFFSNAVFWRWVLHAIFESVFICVMTLYLLHNFDFQYGNFASFVQLGATAFFIVIVVVNVKMTTIQCQWSWKEIAVIAVSILSWILIAVGVAVVPFIDPNFYGVWTRLLQSGVFWLIVFFSVVTIAVKDVLVEAVKREYFFRPEHVLQEIDRKILSKKRYSGSPRAGPVAKQTVIELAAVEDK